VRGGGRGGGGAACRQSGGRQGPAWGCGAEQTAQTAQAAPPPHALRCGSQIALTLKIKGGLKLICKEHGVEEKKPASSMGEGVGVAGRRRAGGGQGAGQPLHTLLPPTACMYVHCTFGSHLMAWHGIRMCNVRTCKRSEALGSTAGACQAGPCACKPGFAKRSCLIVRLQGSWRAWGRWAWARPAQCSSEQQQQ
jgi:hypothetical protein